MSIYTVRLIGGPKRPKRDLTLESWFGPRVEVSGGAYVLVSRPPAFPPSGEEVVYRFEPTDENAVEAPWPS